MIRRHGVSTTLRSSKISRYRKSKIRKLAIDHQLFSIRGLVESVLAIWPRQYQEAYGLINAYTGKFANLHGLHAALDVDKTMLG